MQVVQHYCRESAAALGKIPICSVTIGGASLRDIIKINASEGALDRDIIQINVSEGASGI